MITVDMSVWMRVLVGAKVTSQSFVLREGSYGGELGDALASCVASIFACQPLPRIKAACNKQAKRMCPFVRSIRLLYGGVGRAQLVHLLSPKHAYPSNSVSDGYGLE